MTNVGGDSGTSVNIDQSLLSLLGGQMERAELILFTGAGFSLDAASIDGQPMPSVSALKEIIWPIGFPGEELDEWSTLGDVFDCALERNRALLKRTLEQCLTVSSENLSDHYRTWFASPWKRIYTLNIDDLEQAVQRRFDLPVPIRTISALSEPVPDHDASLFCVHLNGTLQDLPSVTFSAPQYAERLPGRDPWYATLAAELIGHPVIFVGTTLDESPLWQHMELRGDRASMKTELRPRSYLVSPSVPMARRALLRRLNIEHIPMTAAEFSEHVLDRLTSEQAKGQLRLATTRSARRDSGFKRVAELRAESDNVSLPEYLMGRSPVWRDITDGFAILREFEEDLTADAQLLEPQVRFFTGTAGCGKTTTMMRLALTLQARGKDVWWLNLDTSMSIPLMKQAIAAAEPGVVAIDDVDALGNQAVPFVRELARDNPDLRVLLSSRGTRADRLGLTDAISQMNSQLVLVPQLGDQDIDLLLDALDRANRLGKLKNQSLEDKRSALREHANRQLLVAMIEATSGRAFDDKIEDECRQLAQGQSLIYSIACLATRYRTPLTLDHILLASGGAPAERLGDFKSLERQHLIIEPSPGEYTARHRVIAERACAFYRLQGQLSSALEGLLFAFATKLRPTTPRSTREYRVVIRLLNHRGIMDDVGNIQDARRVYNSVEGLMANDYHFWLQRGGLEVQVGDLDLAENYLNQARSLAPDDYMVQTEWAFMSLKRASKDTASGRPGWRERAEEAVAELKDAISRRGMTDRYPFHVLGSQVLGFVRRAPFTDLEKQSLLRDAMEQVRRGLHFHPLDQDLRQLYTDLERDYLLSTVPEENRSSSPKSVADGPAT